MFTHAVMVFNVVSIGTIVADQAVDKPPASTTHHPQAAQLR